MAVKPLEPDREAFMLSTMSPGVYVAIGLVAGTALGVAVNNAYIGMAVGLGAALVWYFAGRALASRRRP